MLRKIFKTHELWRDSPCNCTYSNYLCFPLARICIFSWRKILCYTLCCKSPLDGAAVINLYIVQLINIKICIIRYSSIGKYSCTHSTVTCHQVAAATAFHLLYCSVHPHENWYAYISEY